MVKVGQERALAHFIDVERVAVGSGEVTERDLAVVGRIGQDLVLAWRVASVRSPFLLRAVSSQLAS